MNHFIYFFKFLFSNKQDSDKKNNASKQGGTPVSHKVTPISSPHYKLNIGPSTKFKPMSFNSPGLVKSKLFEGLDDSVSGGESFVPRTSIKKLIIKPQRPRDPSPIQLPDSTSSFCTQPPSPVTSTITFSAPSVTSKPAFPVTPQTVPSQSKGPTPGIVQNSPYGNPIVKPTPM